MNCNCENHKHVLEAELFKKQFIEFTDVPVEVLQIYWDMAGNYIYAWDNCLICCDKLHLALSLMTAHLLKLNYGDGDGQPAAGVVTSATEGSVSGGFQPPQTNTMWEWFLCQTPYGQQLLMLLKMARIGGFYVGGRPETQAIRKVGGSWK